MSVAFLILIALAVVLLKTLHEHQSRSVLIAKDGETLIGSLFQIAEAYDVTTVLDTVQDAVCTAIGLQESMQFQVLIHPERVECLRVEARQEHTHHNQQVNLLFLHALRHILIIGLELLSIRRVAGVRCPHLIIVADGLLQCIPTLHIWWRAYILRILVATHAPLVCLFLVSIEGVDGGDAQVRRTRLLQLLLKLIVIEDGTLHRINGKEAVELPLFRFVSK